MRNKFFIITLAVAIFSFGSLAVPKAEAQFGNLLGDLVGGIIGGNSGAQTVRIISDASESAITTAIKSTLTALTGQQTSDAIEQLLFKEQVLDPAAWAMAKQMQQQLTGELLKWLGGQQPGQNGESPIIQDYNEYYEEVADRVAGEYLFVDKAGDASGQCSPDKSHRVLSAVYNAHKVAQESSKNGGALQCGDTESKNYKSAVDKLLGDFLECQDEACATFATHSELSKKILSEQQIARDLAIIGRGMKTQRVCVDETDEVGRNKNRCRIVNPPSLAADMVSFNLVEMPGLQMLNMDEFNEIASNLMNNLANQALQGLTGVLGLSGNPNYSQNVFGADGNLSYVDALIQDDITQYQTGANDSFKASIQIEREYASLQTHILDEIEGLEDKLAKNREELGSCFDFELSNRLKKIKEESTVNANIASTTLSILVVLDQQYTSSTDAATRSAVLSTYNTYKNQGFFHTKYQIEEIKITFIDLEFAQLVEKFKYDTAVERQKCGGTFDYDGVLNS